MKIAISATNPCHLFPLARELAETGHLDCYYSGYPTWKLAPAPAMRIRTHSFRTNVVYGMQRFLPATLRPDSRGLYLWQDRGFDRWVARALTKADFIHSMPGQCVHTFRRARQLGVRTVLNHATGPVREWVRIMEPEYRRAGIRLTDVCPYDDAWLRQADEEYALADYHCAASTIVRDQLIAVGCDPDRIWTIPYGADSEIFFPPSKSEASFGFRILFAGQAGLRKDIKTLLAALTLSDREDWQADFFGAILPEVANDFAAYRGKPKLNFHGPVSQRALADVFRKSSVLVLVSLEEGFGLVVPQALNCHLPCIVSESTGAKDLIRHHENGSVIPVRDAESLLRELRWWETDAPLLTDRWDWKTPAEQLIKKSAAALAS